MQQRALLKKRLYQADLYVGQSDVAGYGIFAAEPIAADAMIEECPVVPVELEYKTLNNYYFQINDQFVMPLGFGALYNHSDQPNAEYTYDANRYLLNVRALKPIAAGDEICINYGKDWFDERKLVPRLARSEKDRQGWLNRNMPNPSDLFLIFILIVVVYVISR